MTRSGALADLEPALVWTRFLELTRIPRPPKEEEQAREHVLAWAQGLGFPSEVDGEGNVVVRVPPSAGREQSADGGAPVASGHGLRARSREPVRPADRPDRGRARRWLGRGHRDDARRGQRHRRRGGDGVGEDETVEHGPLELLFTVSEEQGLEGAKALDPGFLAGRLLVNLDGGDEQASITVGCAGSIHTFVRLALRPEPVAPGSVALDVSLGGARGGHSGADIASGRVNAIKALGRVLSRARAATPFRLALLEGGVSRNAIPRDARAVVSLAAESETTFRTAAERELAALREQFAGTDDGPDAGVLGSRGEDSGGRGLPPPGRSTCSRPCRAA